MLVYSLLEISSLETCNRAEPPSTSKASARIIISLGAVDRDVDMFERAYGSVILDRRESSFVLNFFFRVICSEFRYCSVNHQ